MIELNKLFELIFCKRRQLKFFATAADETNQRHLPIRQLHIGLTWNSCTECWVKKTFPPDISLSFFTVSVKSRSNSLRKMSSQSLAQKCDRNQIYSWTLKIEAIALIATLEFQLEFAAASWMLKHWDRIFSKWTCDCSNCFCCNLRFSVNVSTVIAIVWVLSCRHNCAPA